MTRRYDMTKPCLHCPFRNDGTAIRFAARERAADIEESAYRNGFPCHSSAEYVEHEFGNGEFDGYHFDDNTQHCAGYIIMMMKSNCDVWPGIENDENLSQWLQDRIDWQAPVFNDTEEFLDANTPPH